MAEYRLHYKKGKIGYAKNHALYILREKNYKTKEDLIYKENGNFETISSIYDDNLAVKFWETADYCERVNSVVYRELEIMIPNELNSSQAVEVIQNFVKKEIGTDYPYSFAIHESYSKETNAKNLHCHLMFSERKIDGVNRDIELFFKRSNPKNAELGGAKKDRTWQKKDRLLELRKSWEVEANLVLEKYGFEERIDCRSLKDRKEEALKNEDFEKAELLDREAINLPKKVVRKLKKVGYIHLSPEEKSEVDKYNKAKEIKAQKIRDYEIRKNKIVPSQEELVKRIENLEKKNEGALKRQTLNIISRGKLNKELYNLRVVEASLIAYPTNETLLNRQKELQASILEIAHEHTLTPKYNRILAQLHRDKETEISLYKSHLKEHYNVEFEVKSREIKKEKNQENQESIRIKYANKSLHELKYRLCELKHQDNSHHSVQILSKYRIEGIGQNLLFLDEKIKELKDKDKELAIYNLSDEMTANKKQLDNFMLQKEKFEKEADLINKELEKNPDKKSSLLEKIDENTKLEKEVLKSLISEREPKNPDIKTEIKNHIQVVVDYENSKRLYNYFIKNNLDEKHNKSIYILHNRLNATEQLYQDSFNKLKEFKTSEIQKVIVPYKANLLNENLACEKRIKTLSQAKDNLKELLDSKKVNGNYTSTQLIALNKITKGEYCKNFLEKEKLKKNLENLNLELKNSSFLKRHSINKKIAAVNSSLEICLTKEKTLLSKYENKPILRDKDILITKNLMESLKFINKEISSSKSKINKNKNLLYKINELEEKKPNKNKSLQRANILHNIKEVTHNLKEILKKGEETQTSYNSLDLNLEKQKEEQWEI